MKKAGIREPQPSKALLRLQEEYAGMCEEQDTLYRPDFEKVFNAMYEIDSSQKWVYDTASWNMNGALPDEADQDTIQRALEKTGFANEEEFCKDFFRYANLVIAGKRNMQERVTLNIKDLMDVSTGGNAQRETGGWYFYPINIFCAAETPEQAKDLQGSVSKVLEKCAEDGVGLFENTTEIEKEDEFLDDLLCVEAYSCQHSLTGYLGDLKRYNVVGNNDGAFLNKEFTRWVFMAVKKCADTIKDNTGCPNKVKNSIAETIKTFDDIPVWGLFFQILTLQGVCHILEHIDLNEGENGYDEAVDLYEWVIMQLGKKEITFSVWIYGENDLKRLRPFCEYLCTTTAGKMVQEEIMKRYGITGQHRMTSEAMEFPDELNTDKARALIARAIEAGFITVDMGKYKWNTEKVLLSYFAVKATDYLGLKKQRHTAEAAWKPFEVLFNMKSKSISGARTDYMKLNNIFEPEGRDRIDALFIG